MFRHLSLTVVVLSLTSAAAATTSEDFNDWFLVEDPPNDNLSAVVSVDGVMATLSASGLVPDGTDIGFQSVDGDDVANSLVGFAFSPTEDFQVAVDFDLSFMDSFGEGGIGFGIGEDSDGMNSAGVALTFRDGITLGFAGAGRTNDIDGLPSPFGPLGGFSSGRMFVRYDGASGDVTVGVSSTKGADMAEASTTLSAIQKNWDDEDLLVSFFLRSEDIPEVIIVTSNPPLVSGDVDAAFSNFEILDGTPTILIPEPSTAALVVLVSVAARSRRREPAGA